MTDVMIWDPLDRGLWMIASCMLFFITVSYLKKAKSHQDKQQRFILYAFSILLLSQGCYAFFTYIKEFFVPGVFNGLRFNGDYASIGFTYELFYKLNWGIGWMGFTGLIFFIEKRIGNTKFLLTIISISVNFLLFLLPLDVLEIYSLDLLIFMVNGSIYYFLLLYLIKNSDIAFKSIPIFFQIAIIFMSWGAVLTYRHIKTLNAVFLFIAPLFYCFSGIFYYLPIILKPKASKKLYYFLGASHIGIHALHLTFLIHLIFYGASLAFNLFALTMGGMLYIGTYILVRDFVFYEKKAQKMHESKDLNLLKSFSKPSSLTEEEVSISKEKKVCLVCKGKVLRYDIYICPDCSSLYHQKCAKTLEGLENACWGCNAPFDEKKPVKLDKEEKSEELEIEHEQQHKEINKGKEEIKKN